MSRAASMIGVLLMTAALARHAISRRAASFDLATVVCALSHVIWLSVLALATMGAMRGGTWEIKGPRFTAVFLFSGMHGIIDDASVRERRIVRSRLTGRLRRICSGATGLRFNDI